MPKIEFPTISAQLEAAPFGVNGLSGLQQNCYYCVRMPGGTRFVAKLENNHWWTCGSGFALNITRDQIICPVKPPEN